MKRGESMKHSITTKYTIMLSGLLIFSVFLCWCLNKTFLVDYYQKEKCDALAQVYEEIEDIILELDGGDTLSEAQEVAIERAASSKNVSAYIIQGKYYRHLKAVYPGVDQLSQDVKDMMWERWVQYYPSPYGILFPNDYDNKGLVETNDYQIMRVTDTRLDLEYLDLVSSYNDEYFTFLRTNYDSIEDNVALSNKFLAYIGLITTVFGSILMYVTIRRMTKPIKQLNEVAKNMSNLDFNERYLIKSSDEIGELGNSINVLSEKLEKTISELKSANNELQMDIEKKTKLDEMRKEFLSNVTHELKTPIALIQGYAEGLQDNINEDEESKDFYCEVIVDEANKMNEMVKKLLSLNQLEFGNNSVEFERFDIVEVIQSVLLSTEILMKQKNVTLHFESSEPIYVWADEYLVEEVLTNYVSNAINHVSGVNIIEVKIIIKEEVVRIAVFNTGVPIPEEDLDQIWIKFYKVDKARTREYGGSGIGLSIVKAIMNSMNRECGVVNHETGVEFWFELDRKTE